MSTEISQLYKGLSYSNKKLHIPALDDFILIEDGVFVMQDAYKTYSLEAEELKGKGSYVFPKSALVGLKAKGTKHYVCSIENNTLKVTLTSKEGSIIKSIALIPRSYNILDNLNKINVSSNHLTCNGVAFVELLKGFDGNLVMTAMEDTLIVNGEGSMDMELTPVFKEMCNIEIKKNNAEEVKVLSSFLVSSIKQLGLVKKDSSMDFYFNDNYVCLTKKNIKVYFTTLK